MDFKIKKQDIYSFIFLITYKLALDFVYLNFIHKLFAYSGFVLEFNYGKYLLSILYFLLIYLAVPKDSKKPSSIFLQLHLIIMIMPMLTLYSFENESGLFMMWCNIFFIMECIILRLAPNLKFIKIKNSNKLISLLVIGLSLFVYGSMIIANGFPSLKALNFLNVYDVRSYVRYPFLMGYLVPWQAKIINPFLITISYIKKSKNMLFVALLMQLLIYLITAHKSFIFIPLAIFIVIKILSKRDFLPVGSLLAPIGVAFAYLNYRIFRTLTIPSIFIRRLLFVPAQLKFNYYDFFSKNSLLYFSEGLLGNITGIKSPYLDKASNLIGYIYGGNIDINANSGYLADAYANMGIFGMFIISILLIVIFVVIDSLSIRIGKEIVIGLSMFSVLSLNDGALLTSLLTGGLLLLIIILYLYSNDVEQSISNINRV